MDKQMTVQLVANAGVLVQWGGRRLLFDGIHTNDNLEFDGLPPELMGQMLCGDGPLADVDYLLFTHEHIDHFSPACTQTYLQNNRVAGVFWPQQGGRRLASLQDYADMAGVEQHQLHLAPGETQRFELGDGLGVTAMGFRHMGAQFHNKENDCFLLTAGEKTLLVTGDADLDYNSFATALDGLCPDAVLVNPLFYLDAMGQRILTEVLRPRHVVVYHLPFEGDSPSLYQKAVLRDAEKRAPLAAPLTLLTHPGQTISL